MCMICVEYQKGIITVDEVRGILSEVRGPALNNPWVEAEDREHILQIEDMLKEDREYDDT